MAFFISSGILENGCIWWKVTWTDIVVAGNCSYIMLMWNIMLMRQLSADQILTHWPRTEQLHLQQTWHDQLKDRDKDKCLENCKLTKLTKLLQSSPTNIIQVWCSRQWIYRTRSRVGKLIYVKAGTLHHWRPQPWLHNDQLHRSGFRPILHLRRLLLLLLLVHTTPFEKSATTTATTTTTPFEKSRAAMIMILSVRSVMTCTQVPGSALNWKESKCLGKVESSPWKGGPISIPDARSIKCIMLMKTISDEKWPMNWDGKKLMTMFQRMGHHHQHHGLS